MAVVQMEARKWWKCVYGHYKKLSKEIERHSDQGQQGLSELQALQNTRERVLKDAEKWLERVVKVVVDKIFPPGVQSESKRQEQGIHVVALCLRYAGDVKRYRKKFKDARRAYELARLALPADPCAYFKLSSLEYYTTINKNPLLAVYYGCRSVSKSGQTNLAPICELFVGAEAPGFLSEPDKCCESLKKAFLRRFVNICAKVASLLDVDDQLETDVEDEKFWLAACTLIQDENKRNGGLTLQDLTMIVAITMFAVKESKKNAPDRKNEEPETSEQREFRSNVASKLICKLLVTLGKHAVDVLRKCNKAIKNKKIRRRQKRKRRTDSNFGTQRNAEESVTESLELFASSYDFHAFEKALGPLSILADYFCKAAQVREQNGLTHYKVLFDTMKEVLDCIQLLAQKSESQSLLELVQNDSDSPSALPPLYEDIALLGFMPCEEYGLFQQVKKPLFDITLLFKDISKTYLVSRACKRLMTIQIDGAAGLLCRSNNNHLQEYGQRGIPETLCIRETLGEKLVSGLVGLYIRRCRFKRLYSFLERYGGGRIARYNLQPEPLAGDDCEVSISPLKKQNEMGNFGESQSYKPSSNESAEITESTRKRLRLEAVDTQNGSTTPPNKKRRVEGEVRTMMMIDKTPVGNERRIGMQSAKNTPGTGQGQNIIGALEFSPSLGENPTPDGVYRPKQISPIAFRGIPPVEGRGSGVDNSRLVSSSSSFVNGFKDSWLAALDASRDLLRLDEEEAPIAWWRKAR